MGYWLSMDGCWLVLGVGFFFVNVMGVVVCLLVGLVRGCGGGGGGG